MYNLNFKNQISLSIIPQFSSETSKLSGHHCWNILNFKLNLTDLHAWASNWNSEKKSLRWSLEIEEFIES